MTKATRPPGSTLSLGAAIGVVLLLAVALLVIRSGQPTQNAGTVASSPSPAQSSPPASSTPASSTPASSGPGTGSQAGAVTGSQTGGTASGSGTTGASTAGTSRSSAVLAAGPLPNTGAPFPWWAGLLPLALGLSLFVALRQRARMDAARYGAEGGGARYDAARDIDDAGLIDRPSLRSGPESGRFGAIREGEQWFSPAVIPRDRDPVEAALGADEPCGPLDALQGAPA
jgi:hypothetical protein